MIDNTYYSEDTLGPHEYLELGDLPLIQGETLQNARLAYRTHGTLNENKDNAILFPHTWSGTSKSMEIFIGDGRREWHARRVNAGTFLNASAYVRVQWQFHKRLKTNVDACR